ncbi:uncharacterized protein K452DRAFT_295875 [Aplosporella prunicola CBS 121167]|uniref:Uncharacterized protein n=1 Tax=Aplosporella prunicola CBS 121167 TaxID=1176127 RepID=A0A6A6BLY9_9PEZI|nr:uncharacterized protein K452DRAFT_295875 [Aplosporella prunicola CBS 121167]KAF2144423.1 hypothetical protein K452DRAFT_295875 [Aplosporella prunicola CBS 121167]
MEETSDHDQPGLRKIPPIDQSNTSRTSASPAPPVTITNSTGHLMRSTSAQSYKHLFEDHLLEGNTAQTNDRRKAPVARYLWEWMRKHELWNALSGPDASLEGLQKHIHFEITLQPLIENKVLNCKAMDALWACRHWDLKTINDLLPPDICPEDGISGLDEHCVNVLRRASRAVPDHAAFIHQLVQHIHGRHPVRSEDIYHVIERNTVPDRGKKTSKRKRNDENGNNSKRPRQEEVEQSTQEDQGNDVSQPQPGQVEPLLITDEADGSRGTVTISREEYDGLKATVEDQGKKMRKKDKNIKALNRATNVLLAKFNMAPMNVEDEEDDIGESVNTVAISREEYNGLQAMVEDQIRKMKKKDKNINALNMAINELREKFNMAPLDEEEQDGED